MNRISKALLLRFLSVPIQHLIPRNWLISLLHLINFQDKFSDTKLSEKLGISRKSLWEKRKKFGIEKR